MPSKKYNVEIDWDALDNCWADRYEADYGQHFSNTFPRISVISPIPAFIRVGT